MSDDKKNLLVATLEHNPAYGYDVQGEQEVYQYLNQLYGMAGRSAYGVEKKVKQVSDLLDAL